MRNYPRYPVLLDAVLLLPDGSAIPASVTDLSTGGAGIETVHRVPSDLDRFTLVVTEPNFEFRVECVARNVRELWGKRGIHAQFVGSNHQETVEDVIQRVRGESNNVAPFALTSAGPVSMVRRLFRRRVA